MAEPKFIVTVGTSAGGMNALSELVAQFDKEMDIAVFIVMHLSRSSISDFLVHRKNGRQVIDMRDVEETFHDSL